ncbi:rod shape-determining protein MreD [Candidatus Poribacteria bacterium]|nr:rod shape-determining protein MreD [Candidatus Poribacteria bacterium]
MAFFTITAFLAGLALAVIESTFMRAVEFASVRPDLAVLAVTVASSRTHFGRVMMLAFVLGFSRDFISGGAIGMNAFSLTFMAYFLALTQDYLLTENWTAQLFVTFVSASVFGILFCLLKITLQYEPGSGYHIVKTIILTSLYTSALGPPAFKLIRKPNAPLYQRLKLKYDVEHETIPESKV